MSTEDKRSDNLVVIFFFAEALVALRDTSKDLPRNLVPPSVIDLVDPPDNWIQWNLSYPNPLGPGVVHKSEKFISLKLCIK